MESIRKYPRTRHIEGSGLQKGDDPEVCPWALLTGKPLVVEEKLDGASVGISFSESGELRLRAGGTTWPGLFDIVDTESGEFFDTRAEGPCWAVGRSSPCPCWGLDVSRSRRICAFCFAAS
jgi:hypothetical protein